MVELSCKRNRLSAWGRCVLMGWSPHQVLTGWWPEQACTTSSYLTIGSWLPVYHFCICVSHYVLNAKAFLGS